MRVKTYKGHSTEFTLKQEHIPFPEGHGNQSDQEVVVEMFKDLKGNMGVRSNMNMIEQCLDNIKKHDEITDGHTNHYENCVKELKKLIHDSR